MSLIPNRNNWIFSHCKTNILENKEEIIKQEFQLQLNRTMQMFKWNNLPKTIPQRDLELILQLNGYAIFTYVDEKPYVFYGSLGGLPNEYYLPTLAVVSNPYLKFSKDLIINEDCIIIQNDGLYNSLAPMFNKYATMLAESIISLRWATINARVPYLIDADNDQTAEDAKEFFDKIISGKELGIIAHNTFFEGIKTYDYASKTTHIKELLELYQYIKANWYNDLGLQANYNMKRESLNADEVALNESTLIPYIDEMLHERKLACERINEKYGLNISVELSSAWKNFRDELEVEQEIKESELEENEKNQIETNS